MDHLNTLPDLNTLPEEIKLQILTRLPTISVLDSKLVCTNWRKIISNYPSFSRMHFRYHLNHPAAESAGKLGFLVFTGRDFRLHYFEYNQNHDQSKNPIQRIRRINLASPCKYFRVAGSCNGLICLLENTFSRPRYVWICNPITRECVFLPKIKRDCDTDGCFYEETCIGYVPSTSEYKIVGFYKSKTQLELEVHIYTLGSRNGWRNPGKFNCGSNLYLEHRVFFANGALYWLDRTLKMIVTFNLAEEKFGEHLSPPTLPPDVDWLCCSLGVLDGFIFFALHGGDMFSDMWILKKRNHNHDKEEGEENQSLGWNNEFKIHALHSNLAILENGGVLTIRDDYFIDIYHTKTLTSKSLVKFNGYIVQAFPHKNTLVSLKELGEEDVKVMESAQIEETESREQLQEPHYIYL